MSTENVKAFMEKAKNDQALQKKFLNMPNDPAGAVKRIVQIGKESGYHFSEQDWREFNKKSIQSGELKESDLAKVSGGTLMTTEALTITIVANLTMTVCRR